MTSVDVLASAVSRVVPRSVGRWVDQARLDAHSLGSELAGQREPSFSTPSRPPLAAPELADVDPIFHSLPRGLRASYALLRGDLDMLARELRGDRPSPVVSRRAVRAVSRPLTLTFSRLEVVELVRETADAVTVVLRSAPGEPALPSFEAGQFLTVHVPIDGVVHKRAYSLCRAPRDGVAITIKHLPGGKVSSHLTTELAVGQILDVLGPSGSFVAPRATLPRHLVFYAGGSGITPIAAILDHVLVTEPGTRATLIFGNRSARDVIFRARLAELARLHAGRLTVVHVLEEPGGLDAHEGRPDVELLRRIVSERALDQRLPGEAPVEHFSCGPRAMMDAVKRVLLERGVAAERIHEERFQSPGAPSSLASLPDVPVAVTLRRKRTGESAELTVSPGKTVLEAALAAGVSMPFSCAMGGCAACKCTALSGEIAMDEPNCLSDEEKARGEVLTCVGRPRGPVTLEVP